MRVPAKTDLLLLLRCVLAPQLNFFVCLCAFVVNHDRQRGQGGAKKHLRMNNVWIVMAWEILPKAIIPCVLSEAAIAVVEVRATR